eukprot:593073-Prymnesium_polylepis.3
MDVAHRVRPAIHAHHIPRSHGRRHRAFRRDTEGRRPDVVDVTWLLHGSRPQLRSMRALRHVAKALVVSVVEGAGDAFARPSSIVLDVPMADWKYRLARWVRQHQDAHVGDKHVLGTIGKGREEK